MSLLRTEGIGVFSSSLWCCSLVFSSLEAWPQGQPRAERSQPRDAGGPGGVSYGKDPKLDDHACKMEGVPSTIKRL